jgi:hypothetical protein
VARTKPSTTILRDEDPIAELSTTIFILASAQSQPLALFLTSMTQHSTGDKQANRIIGVVKAVQNDVVSAFDLERAMLFGNLLHETQLKYSRTDSINHNKFKNNSTWAER